MSSKKVGKKGLIIHSQAREIINHVAEFMSKEAEEGITLPLKRHRTKMDRTVEDKKNTVEDKKKKYTEEEDIKIIKYIINGNYGPYVGSGRFWDDLAEEKLVAGPNSNGLRCHWKKVIRKNLDNYNLPEEDITKLKESMKIKKGKYQKRVTNKEEDDQENKKTVNPHDEPTTSASDGPKMVKEGDNSMNPHDEPTTSACDGPKMVKEGDNSMNPHDEPTTSACDGPKMVKEGDNSMNPHDEPTTSACDGPKMVKEGDNSSHFQSTKTRLEEPTPELENNQSSENSCRELQALRKEFDIYKKEKTEEIHILEEQNKLSKIAIKELKSKLDEKTESNKELHLKIQFLEKEIERLQLVVEDHITDDDEFRRGYGTLDRCRFSTSSSASRISASLFLEDTIENENDEVMSMTTLTTIDETLLQEEEEEEEEEEKEEPILMVSSDEVAEAFTTALEHNLP